MRQLSCERLGEISYESALERQHAVRELVLNQQHPGSVLLLTHPPTITIGRHGNEQNILLDDTQRGAVTIHHVERGGDVTYHGPGQLVGYPIIDLSAMGIRGIKRYLEKLSLVLQRVVSRWGIQAEWNEKIPGLWVGNHKIAAFGIRVTRHVTTHGFALNVSPNLEHFRWIVPCGIQDRGVTSMAALLNGKGPTLAEVSDAFCGEFAWEFGVRWTSVSRQGSDGSNE